MEGKRGDVRLLTIIVLTCFTLIWVLTRVHIITMRQQPHLSPASAMLGQRAISPSNLEAPDAEDLLPPGTTLLERLEADLNNDGRSEVASIARLRRDPCGAGAKTVAIAAHAGNESRKA